MDWLNTFLACVLSVAIIATGIAVSLLAAPLVTTLGAAISSGSLLGGGACGLMYTLLSKEQTWKSFGLVVLKGAIIGAVTALFSCVAGLTVGKLAACCVPRVMKLLYVVFLQTSVGSLAGVITNGISNKMNGLEFFHNWKKAAITGAVVGLLISACSTWNLLVKERAIQVARKMLGKTVETIIGTTVEVYEKFVNSPIRNFVCKTVFEMSAAAMQSGLLQFLTNGKIEWKQLVVATFIYGAVNVARAGFEYRQERRDRNTMEKTFEKYDEQKAMTCEKVLLDSEDGKDTNRVECVATVSDKDGNIGSGVNSHQRVNNAKLIKLREIDRTNPDELASVRSCTEGRQAKLPNRSELMVRCQVGTSKPQAEKVGNIKNSPILSNAQCGCAEVDGLQDLDSMRTTQAPLEDLTVCAVGDKGNKMVIKPPCFACEQNNFDYLSKEPRLTGHVSAFTVDPISQGVNIPAQCIKRMDKLDLSLDDDSGTPTSDIQGISGQAQYTERMEDTDLTLDEDGGAPTYPHGINEAGYVTSLAQYFKLEKDLMKAEEKKRNVKKEKEPSSTLLQYTGNSCPGNKVGVALSSGSHSQNISNIPKRKMQTDNDVPDILAQAKGSPSKIGFPRKLQKKDETKIATVFPLFMWSEEDNKYLQTHESNWPKLPSGGIRVISVLGLHGSGKTTLIHSLLFEMGYAITEQQAIFSKVRQGVYMYMLAEDNLMVLDCADCIDMTGSEQANGTPMGGFLMELFCYIQSAHLIYCANIQENVLDVSYIRDWIATRLLQLKYAACCVGRLGTEHITVLLRSEEPTEKALSEYEPLFAEFHGKEPDEPDAAEVNDENTAEETTTASLEEQKELDMKYYYNVLMMPLRYHKTSTSVNDSNAYRSELTQLLQRMQITKAHFAVNTSQDQEALKINMYEVFINCWRDMIESNNLASIITATANMDQQERNKDSAYIGERMQNFFKSIEQLRADTSDSSLKTKVDDFFKWLKDKGKEYAETADKEKDPIFFFRSVLKISHVLLTHCRYASDIDLKSKGIDLALRGFSLLLKLGDNTEMIETISLKMSVNDYNLIELLQDEQIYMHYSDCWYILYRLAVRGYRLHVLAFGLWQASMRILERDQELFGEKAKVYKWMLHVLRVMCDDDTTAVINPDGSKPKDDLPRIPHQTLEEMCFEFKITRKEWARKLIQNVSVSSLASDNEDFLKTPRFWFDSHEYAKRHGLTFDDVHETAKDELTIAIFQLLFEETAALMSRNIINHSSYFLTRRFENDFHEIGKIRLNILNNAISATSADSSVFLDVLQLTNIRSWLNTEYLTQRNDRHMTQALRLATKLMHTEQFHRGKISDKLVEIGTMSSRAKSHNDKVHTLNEVIVREAREKLIRSVGLFTLQQLESDCAHLAITRLCDDDIPCDDVNAYLSYADWMLYGHQNDEINQMSASIFNGNKKDIVQTVCKYLIKSAKSLTDLVDPQLLLTNLKIIERGCYLISMMMKAFHSLDFEPFYDSTDTDGVSVQQKATRTELISVLHTVYEAMIIRQQRFRDLLSKEQSNSRVRAASSFFCLLWNVSSTSGENLNTVKYKSDVTNIGTHNDNNEPKLKLIVSTESFAELLISDTKGFDYANLVIRGSFLLAQHSGNSHTMIRQQIKGACIISQEETKNILKLEEDIKTIRQKVETKLKRIENLEMEAEKVSDIEVLTKDEDQLIPRNREPINSVCACPAVYNVSTLVGSWPKYQFKERAREIIAVYGTGSAEALHLAMNNLNNSTKKEENVTIIRRLAKHFEDVATNMSDEKYYKLSCKKQMVKRLLSLQGCDDVLMSLGYKKDDVNDSWTTTETQLREKTEEIECFINTINDLDVETVIVHLDSSFSEVALRGESELLSSTLPRDFFQTKQENHLEILMTASIEKLNDMRSHSHFALKNCTVPYRLVRVETTDGVYQAVFPAATLVRDVISKLSDHLKRDTLGLLKRSPNGSIVWIEWKMNLDQVAHFGIYLEAME